MVNLSAGPKTPTERTGAYNKNNRGIARYSYSDVIDMTKGFERELGKGGFGKVYYGCLKDGTEVAVKKLYFTVHGLEQFETEVCNFPSKNLLQWIQNFISIF